LYITTLYADDTRHHRIKRLKRPNLLGIRDRRAADAARARRRGHRV